ncbi:DUF4827 family protein [Dysgonomonas macrotermitis]|uniref:DUF4827 domain-containing protein n=1 Tax=Dysgonomonas macrotermitis TaxID=1346286 RepID=A0A1M4T8G0_9BACT|nr:DUF4827 family protein [Dysgonomonas macrotermitis]SHE40618.1 protein of unknown function [Dysgonomonas macrotermitis]
MRKAALKISGLFVCIMVLFASCDNGDSYADRLNRERKNIKSFINAHDIEVLYTYPESGVFKSNQYYYDSSTGVYINVIDSGNGKRANASNRSVVNVRFWDAMSLPTADSDTITYNPDGVQPIEFLYGVSSTYTSSSTDSYLGTIQSYYMSSGMAVPLQHVGEKAIVSLIVPFNSGSYVQQSGYYAIFFTRLQYTKIIQ